MLLMRVRVQEVIAGHRDRRVEQVSEYAEIPS
jgi:hypothetical protein